MSPDDLLTGPQVAALLGIAASTWRSYVARSQAPAPDDPDEDRPPSRRSPRWRRATVEAWQADRRGQGWAKGVQRGGSSDG